MTTFAPRGLARSAHVQSIVASLPIAAPPRGFVPARAEECTIELGDGHALLARAWWHDRRSGPRDTLLVVHGLAGSSESRYAIRGAVAAYRRGLHVVRLNLRGAGDGARLAATFYHGGLTEDVVAAVRFLLSRAEVARVHVLGFSLGGSVVLLAAAQWAAKVPERLVSAAAISAPLDLASASRWNERAAATPYRLHLLARLRDMVLGQVRRFPDRVRVDERSARTARSVWAFDDAIVAPFHGFASAADYYARVSVGPRMNQIAVPTLLVQSSDDPLVPPASVRPFTAGLTNVRVIETSHGGHVTFATGLWPTSLIDTFAMERVLEHVSAS